MERQALVVRHELREDEKAVRVTVDTDAEPLATLLPPELCPCSAEVQRYKRHAYVVLKDKRGDLLLKSRAVPDIS